MMRFEILHHQVSPADPTGRTYREVNLAKPHAISIGSLVEILPYEDGEHTGVRLFVVRHCRDCDGTPLYSLSWDKEVDLDSMYSPILGGMGEESLAVVGTPEVIVICGISVPISEIESCEIDEHYRTVTLRDGTEYTEPRDGK